MNSISVATVNCNALHFDPVTSQKELTESGDYCRVMRVLRACASDIMCLQEIGSVSAYEAVKKYASDHSLSACVAYSRHEYNHRHDALVFISNGKLNPSTDQKITEAFGNRHDMQPLWGNVIVTRFQMQRSWVEMYPLTTLLWSYGNQHVLYARLCLSGQSNECIVVACTHLSIFSRVRSVQLQVLSDSVARNGAAILCGDMNEGWQSVQPLFHRRMTCVASSSMFAKRPTVSHAPKTKMLLHACNLFKKINIIEKDRDMDWQIDHVITLTPSWTILNSKGEGGGEGTGENGSNVTVVNLISLRLSDHNAVMCTVRKV